VLASLVQILNPKASWIRQVNVYGYVYLILNRVNGKVYIGQTVKHIRDRWSLHKTFAKRGAKWHISRAIAKYGHDSFSIVILHQAFSREELNEMEIRAIESHNSMDPQYGYNMASGGDGLSGYTRDPEIGKKAAVTRKRNGYKHSPETIAKIVAANKGRGVLPEWRERQSEAQRGRKMSPEHRAKLIEINKSRVISDETREKMRLAKLGKKRGPYMKSLAAIAA
jgi:group I intron endonuclease